MNSKVMRSSLILVSTPSLVQSETNETPTEDVLATEENRFPSDHNIANIEIKEESGYLSESGSLDTLSFLKIIANEDIAFENNGYKKISKIRDTLQGELFKAIKMDKSKCKDNRNRFVAIKKTEKALFKQQIAIQDDTNFCVSEDIVKEAIILKYLTFDNKAMGGYIVKYIDFFESDTDYYLVMEYIESQMNLKQFVSKSHEYIKNGKLSIKEYQKIMKYLLWQLFITVQWLHNYMNCCHLDLCMENIMVINANFVEEKDSVSIDKTICIKLCDFGVSEVFDIKIDGNVQNNHGSFLCAKQGLSIDNNGYSAPRVFHEDVYDARAADNWSLGMILYECITNKHLYKPMDIYVPNSGYFALYHGKLKKCLMINNVLQYFNVNTFSLLNGLLNIDEQQRLKGMDILRHKWFECYFKRYNEQITKKFLQQKSKLKQKMKRFPFYG